MKFNEQTAKEIIERLGLDPVTLRVWKTRDKIPDKYADPEYKIPVSPENSGKIIQDRILKVLSYDFVNLKLLCELAEIYPQKLLDVKRGRTAGFTASEIVALKKEVNRVRLLIVKTFERKSESVLRDLLRNELIVVRPILLSGGANNNDYDKTSRFKTGQYHLNDSDYLLIKDCFVKAAVQLSL